MDASSSTKPWHHSLTLWIAILSLVGFAAAVIADQAAVLELNARVVAVLGIVDTIAFAAVRLLRQNEPIQGTPPARALEE